MHSYFLPQAVHTPASRQMHRKSIQRKSNFFRKQHTSAKFENSQNRSSVSEMGKSFCQSCILIVRSTSIICYCWMPLQNNGKKKSTLDQSLVQWNPYMQIYEESLWPKASFRLQTVREWYGAVAVHSWCMVHLRLCIHMRNGLQCKAATASPHLKSMETTSLLFALEQRVWLTQNMQVVCKLQISSMHSKWKWSQTAVSVKLVHH